MRRPTRISTLGVVAVSAAALAIPTLAVAPSEAATQITDSVKFTPATVVDPVLFGGEPGFNFDPTAPAGNRSFVDWPVSSRQNIGVLFRSQDGGLSYTKRYANPMSTAEAGPLCAGRQVPFCPAGGGGDTDVNINGNGTLYMSSQESLANQAVGASFDHGTSFPADHVDPVTAQASGDVDRQWLGDWKGTKTVFLAYHSPLVGEFIQRSDTGGTTGSWSNPSGANAPQIPGVTQSGALVVDNTGGANNHALYIAYLADGINSAPEGGSAYDPNKTPLSGFAVGVSTDGGKTFVNHGVPGGKNARNFTKVYLDNKGNLYATWVDSKNQKTYLSTSLATYSANVGHPAAKWSAPVVVSPTALNVTIFSDVVAGSPGRIAVSYYGTTANETTPDDVKPGEGGWFPFVSVGLNALCQWNNSCAGGPSFTHSHIAHRINQNDNICTSGTACAATGGNRNLLDYFDVSLDTEGHLGYVWSDGNNATKLPFVKVSRQASGPSLYAGRANANRSMRGNGAADAVGDARFPLGGTLLNNAPSRPRLDLLGTTVSRQGSNLVLTVKLKDGTHLGTAIPGDGTSRGSTTTPLQQSKYLVRWEFGGNGYYAGANVAAGNDTPTFFSGTVSDGPSGEPVLAAGGGTTSYGNSYKPLGPATGKVTSTGLTITVPANAVGNPGSGAALYSVGSYVLIGATDSGTALNTLPITVDSSPTFDLKLG